MSSVDAGHAVFAQHQDEQDDDDDDELMDDIQFDRRRRRNPFIDNEAVQVDNENDKSDSDESARHVNDDDECDDAQPGTITQRMLNSIRRNELGSINHFCAEVTSSLPKVVDDKPIVVAHAILQHSKLLLLRFVYWLGKFMCIK